MPIVPRFRNSALKIGNPMKAETTSTLSWDSRANLVNARQMDKRMGNNEQGYIWLRLYTTRAHGTGLAFPSTWFIPCTVWTRGIHSPTKHLLGAFHHWLNMVRSPTMFRAECLWENERQLIVVSSGLGQRRLSATEALELKGHLQKYLTVAVHKQGFQWWPPLQEILNLQVNRQSKIPGKVRCDYHIFRTVRRTLPTKFGRKMGVRLIVRM